MKNKLFLFWKTHKWLLIISLVLLPIFTLLIHLLIGLMIDFTNHNLSIKENPWIWLKKAIKSTKVWPIMFGVLFIYFCIFYKWFKHKTIKAHTKEVDSNDYGNAKWIEQTEFNQLFSQTQFNSIHNNSSFIVASQKQVDKTLINIASNPPNPTPDPNPNHGNNTFNTTWIISAVLGSTIVIIGVAYLRYHRNKKGIGGLRRSIKK